MATALVRRYTNKKCSMGKKHAKKCNLISQFDNVFDATSTHSKNQVLILCIIGTDFWQLNQH